MTKARPLLIAATLCLALAVTAVAQETRPTSRPAEADGGGRVNDMGRRLVEQLRATDGCLDAQAVRMPDGRAVIFGWFKDKTAAMNWYRNPMHTALRHMSRLADDGREPMADVPDGTPIMAVACLSFDGPPAVAGSAIPFSSIAIELYSPLEGGLKLGRGFAPDGFMPATRPTTAPAAP